MLPYIPDGTSIVALADMKEKNAVDVSGMKPGCQYIFTVASRNRHGYSKLSPISDLITTASTVPEAPATPGISHPSSTELTLHFIMPHDNGSKILKIFLIIREGKVIAKMFKNRICLTIIPHTLKLTNLVMLKNNDIVNVELDIFSKYIINMNS